MLAEVSARSLHTLGFLGERSRHPRSSLRGRHESIRILARVVKLNHTLVYGLYSELALETFTQSNFGFSPEKLREFLELWSLLL